MHESNVFFLNKDILDIGTSKRSKNKIKTNLKKKNQNFSKAQSNRNAKHPSHPRMVSGSLAFGGKCGPLDHH
jgi:hypothetical protein